MQLFPVYANVWTISTLISRSRVLLEELTVPQTINVHTFMGPGDSLTFSQDLDSGPCPEPCESDPHPHSLFFDDPL